MEWLELLNNFTLRTVALGAAVLGIVSGTLGSFAFLRRQSLLGDAMAHAALPGVVLAFMLTGTKSPIALLLGAAIAGLISTAIFLMIIRYTRIKEDAALGLILSIFFGFGLMLLSFVQRDPSARQAGLDTFLFGQAATMLPRDVVVMAIVGALAIGLCMLFWKEFTLLSFDRDFGATLGFAMRPLDFLLTGLLVVAIVIGLQAVGVVLMSAMVVAPAAAARQWTDSLWRMVILSSLFGALAGVIGAVISALGRGLSTGPLVVLVASGIVILSLIFAPKRGIFWAWVRRRRNRRNLQVKPVLIALYSLARQHPNLDYPHSADALDAILEKRGGVEGSLTVLSDLGLTVPQGDALWSLTAAGVNEAERLLAEAAGL